MPAWWLIASFTKLVGIVLLSAGLVGAVLPGPTSRRMTAALSFGTWGLLLTWMGGYAIMKITERSLSAPFISQALLVSLVGLAAAWLAATRARPSLGTLFLPVAGLLSALGAMVTRELPMDAPTWLLRAAVPVLLGAVAAFWLRGQHDAQEHDAALVQARTRSWWRWLARAEGTSLLVLLGFVTPAKLFLGWHLDPDGYVGWAHGSLVLLYVASLLPMRRWHDWSFVRLGLAFVASLLPLGTFLFERRFLKED